MRNSRKEAHWIDIGEDARRQFIDAQAVFEAWEEARKNTAEVRGGMYWKRQSGTEYLIRTSPQNSQKSLGPKSAETKKIYGRFVTRKEQTEKRLSGLTIELVRHQRMNRALHVGRAPRLVVDIINQLARSGLSDYFMVCGTQSLYAYEAAAGVRFGSVEAMATRDMDLLWDTRKRISFMTQMEHAGSSLLQLFRKVDATFEIRWDQKYTAVNSKGFEVDVIRREVKDGDPHPLKLTDNEEDFYAVQARKAGVLLDGPRFSSMIVSATGHMARMLTISPRAFVRFKRWMAGQSNRDPMKRRRDVLQADLVEELVKEYLPQLHI